LKKIRLTEQGFVLPYIVRRNAKRSILMRKTAWQPEQPLPQYADKPTAAAIVTHHFFPISPRTLERWPLTVRRPNKATVYEVDELMAVAEAKLKSAYAYKQAEG